MHPRGDTDLEQAEIAEELATRLLRDLCARLRRAFPFTDPDIASDAVEDALLEYMRRPHAFDPARGVSLERFLYLASWRNVVDRLKGERRRRRREAEWAQAFIAEASLWRRYVRAAGERSLDDDALRVRNARLRAFAMVKTPAEADALRRWLDGERHWQPLALALGVTHLGQSEQRREVKCFKDRWLKRLLRSRRGRDGKRTG